MSIVAFKRKSVIQYGTHISGRKPGGIWAGKYVNDNGFSINGPYRNKGSVGTTMQFSKTKTLFKGVHAVGWGGMGGRYYNDPLLVVNGSIIVPGTQYQYIKPSVVSNAPIKNCNLVKPVQNPLYIQTKTSKNDCVKGQWQTESDYITRLTRCSIQKNPTIVRCA